MLFVYGNINLHRAFEEFIKLNRYEYDPDRTIHRDCKYPQKKDPEKRVGTKAFQCNTVASRYNIYRDLYF